VVCNKSDLVIPKKIVVDSLKKDSIIAKKL